MIYYLKQIKHTENYLSYNKNVIYTTFIFFAGGADNWSQGCDTIDCG